MVTKILINLLTLVLAGLTSIHAATYTVTSNADTGVGSIRDVISTANGTSGSDLVQFQPGLGTITLASNIIISEPVWIEGQGQTISGQGSSSFSLLIFNGNSQGNTLSGVALINGFQAAVFWTNNNWVYNCVIGTDWDGNVGLGNSKGIVLADNTQFNYIGGTSPNYRNVVAASTTADIYLYLSANNKVQGNYFGISPNGTTILSQHPSVHLHYATSNLIGGTSNNERNIIVSNHYGVYLNLGATGNTIVGNWIGVLPNGQPKADLNFQGIYGLGQHNWIGLPNGQGNLIAGWQYGLEILGTNNALLGNTITTFSSQAITLTSGGNINYPAPSELYADSFRVSGTAQAYDSIELFLSDRGAGLQGGSLSYVTKVQADSQGRFESFSAGLIPGQVVCALATDLNNNTSAFSINVLVGIAPPPPSHTMTPTQSPTPTVSATITVSPTISATASVTPIVTNQSTATTTTTPIATNTAIISTPTASKGKKKRYIVPGPNPANEKVSFAFTNGQRGDVVIRIYKMSGELIAVVKGKLAGQSGQTIIWNTAAVAPGIYLVQPVIDGVAQEKVKVAITR